MMRRHSARLVQTSPVAAAAAATGPLRFSGTRVILSSDRPSIAPELLKHESSFHHMIMRDAARHPADKVAFKCVASGQTLKYGEIAALVGAPLGTVKTRMRDGLTRLRGELGVTT